MKKGFRVAFIILMLVILYLPILILAVYSLRIRQISEQYTDFPFRIMLHYLPSLSLQI